MRRLFFCMVCCFMLYGCGHREAQTTLRMETQVDFPVNASFAIARQAYPSTRNKRISGAERAYIEKEIREFIISHGFTIADDAPYVISFYREYYNPETEGALEVVVVALLAETRLKYSYNLSLNGPSNNRDGMLVIDVVDVKSNIVFRQSVAQYYFGRLESAYRESRDLAATKRYSALVTLGNLFNMKFAKEQTD